MTTIIPIHRYVDAPAAIAFLRDALGFEEKLVVPGPDGSITHAQLVLGDGMVMVGSLRGEDYEPVGGGAYVVVPDVDAHHERAVAAGARVVVEPCEQDDRGRFYSVRDPEDHLWSFGTYDPTADG